MISDFRFQVSGFGFRISGLWSRVRDFGYRVHPENPEVGAVNPVNPEVWEVGADPNRSSSPKLERPCRSGSMSYRIFWDKWRDSRDMSSQQIRWRRKQHGRLPRYKSNQLMGILFQFEMIFWYKSQITVPQTPHNTSKPLQYAAGPSGHAN